MLQLVTRFNIRHTLLLSYFGYLYVAVVLHCLWWAYFGRTTIVTTFVLDLLRVDNAFFMC
ncbi:hypothetical protein C7N43_29280 [Sphingobacteriales bacterium UPWRP_1]|nr:hypothetical protein BVG80_18360 [Sphingobacteriales bacterium TSM_CSM]PSJ73395.1 hypothetical protein C7N43_29280 [Sphingobacteriales bacterium UPWRP_1]